MCECLCECVSVCVSVCVCVCLAAGRLAHSTHTHILSLSLLPLSISPHAATQPLYQRHLRSCEKEGQPCAEDNHSGKRRQPNKQPRKHHVHFLRRKQRGQEEGIRERDSGTGTEMHIHTRTHTHTHTHTRTHARTHAQTDKRINR